jgi:hypothetical protein
MQVDCHSEGINFNEFIAAMFDAQDLATQQVAMLVSPMYSLGCAEAGRSRHC